MNKAKQSNTIPSIPIRRDQLVTLGDLADFKAELLEDLKRANKELGNKSNKQWLKSHELQKLLGISPGTLQTLRNNSTIPYTKIGNVIFYNIEDINKMMQIHSSLNY